VGGRAEGSLAVAGLVSSGLTGVSEAGTEVAGRGSAEGEDAGGDATWIWSGAVAGEVAAAVGSVAGCAGMQAASISINPKTKIFIFNLKVINPLV
jgi:hypothetical protein